MYLHLQEPSFPNTQKQIDGSLYNVIESSKNVDIVKKPGEDFYQVYSVKFGKNKGNPLFGIAIEDYRFFKHGETDLLEVTYAGSNKIQLFETTTGKICLPIDGVDKILAITDTHIEYILYTKIYKEERNDFYAIEKPITGYVPNSQYQKTPTLDNKSNFSFGTFCCQGVEDYAVHKVDGLSKPVIILKLTNGKFNLLNTNNNNKLFFPEKGVDTIGDIEYEDSSSDNQWTPMSLYMGNIYVSCIVDGRYLQVCYDYNNNIVGIENHFGETVENMYLQTIDTRLDYENKNIIQKLGNLDIVTSFDEKQYIKVSLGERIISDRVDSYETVGDNLFKISLYTDGGEREENLIDLQTGKLLLESGIKDISDISFLPFRDRVTSIQVVIVESTGGGAYQIFDIMKQQYILPNWSLLKPKLNDDSKDEGDYMGSIIQYGELEALPSRHIHRRDISLITKEGVTYFSSSQNLSKNDIFKFGSIRLERDIKNRTRYMIFADATKVEVKDFEILTIMIPETREDNGYKMRKLIKVSFPDGRVNLFDEKGKSKFPIGNKYPIKALYENIEGIKYITGFKVGEEEKTGEELDKYSQGINFGSIQISFKNNGHVKMSLEGQKEIDIQGYQIHYLYKSTGETDITVSGHPLRFLEITFSNGYKNLFSEEGEKVFRTDTHPAYFKTIKQDRIDEATSDLQGVVTGFRVNETDFDFQYFKTTSYPIQLP